MQKQHQRQHKVELVANLKSQFVDAKALLICDYKGLSVKKLEALRNKARNQGIKVQVIKNTLAHIAMKEAGYSDLDLKEPMCFCGVVIKSLSLNSCLISKKSIKITLC